MSTYESVSTAGDTAAGTSVACNRPTGATTDDVLICIVGISGNEDGGCSIGNDTVNGAWTELYDDIDNATTNMRLAIYRLVCSSGAPDASWTASWTDTADGRSRVIRISGADGATPEDVAINVDAPSGTFTTQTCQSVTTVTDNALVLRGAILDRRTFSGTPVTNIFNDDAGSSADISLACGHETQVTAGAVGTEDYTSAIADQCMTFTLAIRPAAGGGGATPHGPLGHPLFGSLRGPVY